MYQYSSSQYTSGTSDNYSLVLYMSQMQFTAVKKFGNIFHCVVQIA